MYVPSVYVYDSYPVQKLPLRLLQNICIITLVYKFKNIINYPNLFFVNPRKCTSI